MRHRKEEHKEEPGGRKLLALGLTALGVVFGDIGTSPLYSLRECFLGKDRLAPTPVNILGVLSLIFWALIIVISVKYLLYVMRLDNGGEGGILALMALLRPKASARRGKTFVLSMLGLFGAALLYGDGMITPAISVLSAVEGLSIATHALDGFVIPVTVGILVLLFAFQHRGTSSIGSVFGPVMLVWFSVLALLGIAAITQRPEVLAAISPLHAVRFFAANGWAGFLILGAVFLVVTGGEALYADMGQFGRRPIQGAWFFLVLPALLLNYFGQGAALLSGVGENSSPFYRLAPSWALYPLVILATLATVIASQAIISGAFSLTRQAVLIGDFPPVNIIQTSPEEIGQVYIPGVNWVLMVATIGLVIGFRTSSNLAGAYGVAVTTTMVITTILAYQVIRRKTKKKIGVGVLAATAAFLVVDLGFFGANIFKIPDGGWFPLLVGGGIFFLMLTWQEGRQNILSRFKASLPTTDRFFRSLSHHPPHRVRGTAVFLTRHQYDVPPILLHHLRHDQVLHEVVVLMTIVVEPVPRVSSATMLEVSRLRLGFTRVVVHYGYMQTPNVPAVLRQCKDHGLDIDPDTVTYYIRRQNFIATDKYPGMAIWREKLFAWMARNATTSPEFFKIPAKNVVELGIEVEI